MVCGLWLHSRLQHKREQSHQNQKMCLNRQMARSTPLPLRTVCMKVQRTLSSHDCLDDAGLGCALGFAAAFAFGAGFALLVTALLAGAFAFFFGGASMSESAPSDSSSVPFATDDGALALGSLATTARLPAAAFAFGFGGESTSESSHSSSVPSATDDSALALGCLAAPARLVAGFAAGKLVLGLAAGALLLGQDTSKPSSSALVVSKSVSGDGRALAANIALMLPFPLEAGFAAVAAFAAFGAAANGAPAGLGAAEGLGTNGGLSAVAFLGAFLTGAKSSSSESPETSESDPYPAFFFLFFVAFFAALPARGAKGEAAACAHRLWHPGLETIPHASVTIQTLMKQEHGSKS